MCRTYELSVNWAKDDRFCTSEDEILYLRVERDARCCGVLGRNVENTWIKCQLVKG